MTKNCIQHFNKTRWRKLSLEIEDSMYNFGGEIESIKIGQLFRANIGIESIPHF